MIMEYTDVTEFKRLIEEKKIKHERVKSYLKKRGILFTATNSEVFAKQIYTIFLGCKEMSDITEMFQGESNFEKSLMLKAKPKDDLPSDTNLIDFFVDEISRFRSMPSAYSIEQPIRNENSDQISVYFSYEKRSPGKNKLLQTERRNLKFSVRKISNEEVAIDIRQQSSTDSSEAIKLLSKIAGLSEESTFSLIHVNLLSLPPKSSVDFFDRLMKKPFSQWKLKTITGLTLKKVDSSDADDDDDETEIIEDEGGTPVGTLAGISQAALQGSGLQHNQFVKNTLAQGYVISSMRFRYAYKRESTEFAVVVSCKGSDLRIDIDKTYAEENGQMYVTPFPKSQQDEIILEFQNISNAIYAELRNELDAEAQPLNS